MNILLDTQIALWALTDSPRLSVKAREWIMDAGNTVFFSAASVWEIAIKHKLARGDMPVSGAEAARLFREAGYMELPVTALHAAATENLPAHHADPFDRILVAQAMQEPLRLLTHDRQLISYGDWVEFASSLLPSSHYSNQTTAICLEWHFLFSLSAPSSAIFAPLIAKCR